MWSIKLYHFILLLVLGLSSGCVPLPFPRPVGGMHISGIVVDDSSGLPLEGATVTTTLNEDRTTTDANGKFEVTVGDYWRYFLTIPLGPYESLGYGRDARRFSGTVSFSRSGYSVSDEKVEFSLPLECKSVCPPDWGGQMSTSRQLDLGTLKLNKQ